MVILILINYFSSNFIVSIVAVKVDLFQKSFSLNKYII